MRILSQHKLRRRSRIRFSIRQRSHRVRLSVFRSARHIYVQLIDDSSHRTLAMASSLDPSLRAKGKPGGDIAAAVAVGRLIAERAKKAGVEEVVFDRGHYAYHGRLKALADSAREAGLHF